MPIFSQGAASIKGFGFTKAAGGSAFPGIASTFYSTTQTYGMATAGDTSGNFYIGGFDYTAGGGCLFIAKFNGTTGALIWQVKYADNQNQLEFTEQGLAVDSSGNVYATMNNNSYGNRAKVAVIKLNSSGTLQWQRYLYTSNFSESHVHSGGLAINSAGTLIAVSFWYYDPPFYQKAGIAIYDSSGTLQWQRKLSYNTNYAACFGKCAAFDSSGNVYMMGQTDVSGVSTAFLAKWNSSGTIQWQTGYSGYPQRYPGSLGIDSSNNIYMSVYYNNMLTKVNSSGTKVWSVETNTGGYAVNPYASTDPSGNSYSSWYDGSGNFYSSKVNSSGTCEWMNKFTVTGVTGVITNGSALVGNPSTGSYFAQTMRYTISGSNTGSAVFKIARDGTGTTGTSFTAAPITFTYTASAGTSTTNSQSLATISLTDAAGTVLETTGGMVAITYTFSSNTVTF